MVNHMYNGHTNNTCLHGTHLQLYLYNVLYNMYTNYYSYLISVLDTTRGIYSECMVHTPEMC